MGDYVVRTFLKSISDNLTNSEIVHLKHLCSSYVGISFLERAKDGVDLFVLLLQHELIKTNDLSFLRDILKQIHRHDLANKVDNFTKSPRERIESESAAQSRTYRHQASVVDPYRVLLKKISDELTSRNVSDIKFVIDLPGGKKEQIHDGNSLLSTLETCDMIGPSNLGLLENVLQLAHRNDLIKKVMEYSKGPPAVNPPKREPSEHGPMPSPTSKPLLTPGHFKKSTSSTSSITPPPAENLSITNDPAVNVIHPKPRLSEQYSTDRDPRGWCLIISNEEFIPSPEASRLLTHREGTSVDVKNLKSTFEMLRFKVLTKHNLKASEIYQEARNMAMVNHMNYDCFVCCILSHGALGSIYGSDCLPIPVKDITSQFTGISCPTLSSKPKLFFIQACRGEDKDKGASIQQATDAVEMDEDDAIRNTAEPQESHFLLGYATPPGYVSWRSTQHGSWYISKLCEVLMKYANNEHVMDMMLEVNRQVSEAYTAKGFKQCPAPVVTLTKKVYLTYEHV